MQTHHESWGSTLLPYEYQPSRSPFHEAPSGELYPSSVDALLGEFWTRRASQGYDDGYHSSSGPMLLELADSIDPQLLDSPTEPLDPSDSPWCHDPQETPVLAPHDLTYDSAYTLSGPSPDAWSSDGYMAAPRSVLTDDTARFLYSSPGASPHTFSEPGYEPDYSVGEENMSQHQDVDHQTFEDAQKSSLHCTKPRCNRRFNSRGDRRRHEETVHMEAATLKGYRCAFAQCPKGDKIWTRLDNFKLHLVKAHGLQKNSPYVKEMVVKSARSAHGFDARFPFIEVDPRKGTGDMI